MPDGALYLSLFLRGLVIGVLAGRALVAFRKTITSILQAARTSRSSSIDNLRFRPFGGFLQAAFSKSLTKAEKTGMIIPSDMVGISPGRHIWNGGPGNRELFHEAPGPAGTDGSRRSCMPFDMAGGSGHVCGGAEMYPEVEMLI